VPLVRRAEQPARPGTIVGVDEIRETKLPGVGVRHEFTSEGGQDLGVLVHHDGRREILVYDAADPDACSSLVTLSASDSRTLSELLGASQVVEAVAAVQQHVEGLSIEWIDLEDSSPAVGASIGDGRYRTRTGSSVVAVIRDGESVPAPGPDFVLADHDLVVAVGTSEGLVGLRSLLRP